MGWASGCQAITTGPAAAPRQPSTPLLTPPPAGPGVQGPGPVDGHSTTLGTARRERGGLLVAEIGTVHHQQALGGGLGCREVSGALLGAGDGTHYQQNSRGSRQSSAQAASSHRLHP